MQAGKRHYFYYIVTRVLWPINPSISNGLKKCPNKSIQKLANDALFLKEAERLA